MPLSINEKKNANRPLTAKVRTAKAITNAFTGGLFPTGRSLESSGRRKIYKENKQILKASHLERRRILHRPIYPTNGFQVIK